LQRIGGGLASGWNGAPFSEERGEIGSEGGFVVHLPEHFRRIDRHDRPMGGEDFGQRQA
jgi:hypothetical protein